MSKCIKFLWYSINERFEKRKGKEPRSAPSLYIKAIVLKVRASVFGISIKESLGIRIPNSKLNYWEIKNSSSALESEIFLFRFTSIITSSGEEFVMGILRWSFSRWNFRCKECSERTRWERLSAKPTKRKMHDI